MMISCSLLIACPSVAVLLGVRVLRGQESGGQLFSACVDHHVRLFHCLDAQGQDEDPGGRRCFPNWEETAVDVINVTVLRASHSLPNLVEA